MSTRDYYKSPQIKKSGYVQNYTKEELEEYIKCTENPEYFIEKYMKVVSLDEGLVKFKLRSYQKRIIAGCHNNRNSIILSGRQSGKTITMAGYILWYALFNPDKIVAILANKGATAREILSRITIALEAIPFFLQPGCEVLNKSSIEFANGAKIIAAATSASSIRGLSVNLLYLDEFAFVENAIEFYKSTFPVVTSGKTTKVIVTSTPNGMNLFYKLWSNAKQGISTFIPIEVKWTEVPGRDKKWREETIKDLGEAGFRQEYENEFLGSSNTLISGVKLEELAFITPQKSQDYLDVYKKVKPGRKYALVADVSRGAELDYSIAVVIDVTSYPHEIVAKYKNNGVSPLKFPDVLVKLGKIYNSAWILVENNDAGGQVADALNFEHEYENIISVAKTNKGQIVSGGFTKNTTFGVNTSKAVKRIGCLHLKTLIESDQLIINDFDIIEELYTFTLKGASWQAEAGKQDDLVMGLVLYSWLSTQTYWKELIAPKQNIDKKKGPSEDELDERFRFFVDGDQDHQSLFSREEIAGLF